MSRPKRNPITRFYRSDVKRGWKIVVTSMVVGGLCMLPLLLYIAFGPADGNPIGLGLLAMLGAAILQIGLLVGAIWVALQYLRRRAG